MEACPWQIGLPEEIRCQIKNLFDIPCDEIHIAIVEASCATCESECFRSVFSCQRFFQLVTEIKDLLAAFVFMKGINGIEEKARNASICMEVVHEIIVSIQISIDKRYTACGSCYDIKTEVSLWIFVWLHVVSCI